MPQLERRGLSFHVQLLGAGPPLAMLHGLFVGSLAAWYFGAGPKLAPRLLSEIGDDRNRFGDEPQALQCLAGTAPVTRRTGKARGEPPRWPCQQRSRL